jgi:hypothetical protein
MRAEFPSKSPTVGLNWASAIFIYTPAYVRRPRLSIRRLANTFPGNANLPIGEVQIASREIGVPGKAIPCAHICLRTIFPFLNFLHFLNLLYFLFQGA